MFRVYALVPHLPVKLIIYCTIGAARLAVHRFGVSCQARQLGVRPSQLYLILILDLFKSLRHYIGIFREETLLTRLSNILSSVKIHDFQVVSLEPHQKDGGVFVQFTYNTGEPASALKSLQKTLREEAGKRGGMPSWIGMAKGDAWLVKGTPWKEVMSTFVLNNFLFLLLRVGC